MSHHPGKVIICPNCGFSASHNYCAQCGQETHLHKENFWGLVTHFISHYFHYDSKFWKTLKALWFSPGKLTTAYWKAQRMRYIPPVSLYIFISAVFFLIYFSQKQQENVHQETKSTALHSLPGSLDSLDELPPETAQEVAARQHVSSQVKSLQQYIDEKSAKISKEHGMTGSQYVKERFRHNFPKLFFFMIPVVAFLLKLLFLRRKEVHFVHHAVFSLHIHSLFFSIFLLSVLNPFNAIQGYLDVFLTIAYIVYFVLSIRNVYDTGYRRAIMSTFFVGAGYILFFLLAIAFDFFIILYLA